MNLFQRFGSFHTGGALCFLAVSAIFLLDGSATFAQRKAPAAKARRVEASKKLRYSPYVSRENEHAETPLTGSSPYAPRVDGSIDQSFSAAITEGRGWVYDTAVQSDGKIVVVGLFQRANGFQTTNIARLNADGTRDLSFAPVGGPNGEIRAVAIQGDGKIIVAGAFTQWNGQNRSRIVRLLADGTVDPNFNTGVTMNGQVNDVLVLPDGKIMVGGAFSNPAPRLLRLNADGSLDPTSFGIGPGVVHSIADAPDGKFVVGGQFEFPRPNIARFTIAGALDESFTPFGAPPPGWPIYRVAAQPDGKVVAGGAFRTFGNVPTDSVVRLTETGALDKAFEFYSEPNDGSEFTDLFVWGIQVRPDGKLLISYFRDSAEQFADVKRFNSDATIDNSFETNTDDSLVIASLQLLSDGSILAGGAFTTVNGQQRLRLVKLGSEGALDASFAAALSATATVYAIERLPNGQLMVGGSFDYVNGKHRPSIARLNPNGTLDESFKIGEGFSGRVHAIEPMADGSIMIGGVFFGDARFPAYAIARVGSNGEFIRAPQSAGNFISAAYSFAELADGKLLVGGQIFDESAGEAKLILRFHSDDTLDTSFVRPAISDNGVVQDILVQADGKIVAGGSFLDPPGGPFLHGLVRVNADGTWDNSFSVGAGTVFALEGLPDGKFYTAGITLSRRTADGAIDSGFSAGSGFNNSIRDIEIQPNGKIMVAGLFSSYDGTPVNRLARLTPTGALDPTFVTSGPSGGAYAVEVQPDGRTIVGGNFLNYGAEERFSIVRLNNMTGARRTPFDFDGDGKADRSVFRPGSADWWTLWSGQGDAAGGAMQFGVGTDRLAPADYTGDGLTDVAVWRPADGMWYVLRSEDGSYYGLQLGGQGDVPVPADYDGDGRADHAVFRPGSGTWYIIRSGDGGVTIQQFGQAGDQPVAGDYDADGRADMAIWRKATGDWWILRSNLGLIVVQFGTAGDKAAPADFTGDGAADVAIFRPSTGFWYVLRSEDFSFYGLQWGVAGDVPVPADYDGDGKADPTVWRPGGGGWWTLGSRDGFIFRQWGLESDVPVPSAFVRE